MNTRRGFSNTSYSNDGWPLSKYQCNNNCNNECDCDAILAEAHQNFNAANQMHAKADALLRENVRDLVYQALSVLKESNDIRKDAIALEENTEWKIDKTNCGLDCVPKDCSRLAEATAYEYGKEDANRKELVVHMESLLDLIDETVEVDGRGDNFKKRYTECIHSCK